MDGLTADLGYAAKGLYVLPVGLDSQPQTRHGVYDATIDPATIERWFARQPGRGLAIATGGPRRILALDADVKHGVDGIATYHGLVTGDKGEPWQTTPSGGEHHLFTYPTGVKVGNGVSFLGPGLDHRGDRGYIVVPPTVTPKGAYCWQRDPFSHPIPELPDRIVDLLTKPKPRPTATGKGSGVMAPVTLESAIGWLAAARPGTRNDMLNLSSYLLGRLVTAGKVCEDDARRLLTETALSIGLTPKETAATIESGLIDGMAVTGVMPLSETIENAWHCLSWGLSSPWPGRCGLSDRRVFAAHCLIALRCGQETYGASVRELAELANVGGIATVKAASERLTEQGLIELVRLAGRGQFTPSGYRLRTIRTITQGGFGGSAPLGDCSVRTHAPTAQGHDAFCRRGLGPTAALVWDSLTTHGPATAAELSDRTGRGRRSVEKALRRMTPVVDAAPGEAYHMLTKSGMTYAAKDCVDLDAVARLLHVDGEGRRRHEQHERERERHSRSWQEERTRQWAGTIPKPAPLITEQVRREEGVHKRLRALRGVREHQKERCQDV